MIMVRQGLCVMVMKQGLCDRGEEGLCDSEVTGRVYVAVARQAR